MSPLRGRKLPLRSGEGSPIVDHADHAGLDVAVRKEQPPHEVLERGAKVLEVICIEQRIADRIDVREDDAEIQEEVIHLALRTESHHAVDSVEREPADNEEEDDAREILRSLDLPFARRAKDTQHRPGLVIAAQTTAKVQTAEATNRTTTAGTGVHRDDLL